MKLKIDENGNAVITDGKPVYIHDDGKEIPFDAKQSVDKIAQLNDENAGRRLKNEEYETVLKTYAVEGEDGKPALLDPKTAQEAMATVKNLDDKQLLDAKGVEKLKGEMSAAYLQKEKELTKSFGTKIDDLSGQLGKKDSTIYSLMVKTRFANSPTISEKTILPPDIASKYFGDNFKVEGEGDDAKVIGYLAGEQIFSRERPGEPAKFEEALTAIIDAYPMKDRILKTAGSGSGSQGGTGTTHQQEKDREAFQKLPATERLRQIHKQKGGSS